METLFIVIETLNLLAKPISVDAVADYYIVPCMLQKANPGVIRPLINDPDTVTTVTLCLKFDNPFIPQAVWDKMIASCVHRFQRLDEPGYDGIKLIQRGFVCLSVNVLWNMVMHCKDNTMKVTIFTKVTHSSTVGAGTSLFCIVQNLLHRILEQNQQSHLKYQLFLHNNYRLTSDEKMVKIEDLEKFSRLQCNGPNGQDWINKDDMNVWFKDQGREGNRITKLPAELVDDLPVRKLTYTEIGRISRYIGSAYQTFFVELGCPSEVLEQEMEEHRHFVFRSRLTKIFLQLANLRVDINFSTVAEAMLKNGMDPVKLIATIDSNRGSVYQDKRLPETGWLQKALTVDDVTTIQKCIGVKTYFNLFLELGFKPNDLDEFDDHYRNRITRTKIKALLKAFITEKKPPPNRDSI